MTTRNDPTPFGAALSQSAASELAALRERIQVQYALLDIHERTESQASFASRLEIRDAIGPVMTVEDRSDANASDGASAPTAEVAADMNLELIPERASWWPTHENRSMGLRPNAGWAVYSLTQSGVGVIGFSLCGLSPTEVEAGIEMVSATQRQKRNFIPLFLTDQQDLTPFRNRGFVVEYLPPVPPSYVSPARWKQYLAVRREFLTRKWSLARIVDLGGVVETGPDMVTSLSAPPG